MNGSIIDSAPNLNNCTNLFVEIPHGLQLFTYANLDDRVEAIHIVMLPQIDGLSLFDGVSKITAVEKWFTSNV